MTSASTREGRPGLIMPVRVACRTRTTELRAVRIVWLREMVRFFSDRMRIAMSLVQPFLFLFVLGTGLSLLTTHSVGGVSLRTYIYPGSLCLAVLLTAMSSAGSIVWDREFGFLRETLVAPVRRSSIVIGKCLGGATVGGLQGILVIAVAGLVGVPYSPVLLLEVLGIQLLLAFTVTAFGVMISARVAKMSSFMALNNMLIMPLYFLSGAMFPLAGLPLWLTICNRLDPLSYAVDPIRRLVFSHVHVDAQVRARLAGGVTWDGWRVPTLIELSVLAGIGLVMLAIAVAAFSKID